MSNRSFPSNLFVSARLRPPQPVDEAAEAPDSLAASGRSISAPSTGAAFEFDRVFGTEASTAAMADELGPQIVPAFLSGVSVCCLGWGATGSFKGRTFLGGEGSPGLIEILMDSIFSKLEATKLSSRTFLSLSAFQLFPSLVLDLLVPNTKVGAVLGDFNSPNSLASIELSSREQFSVIFQQLQLVRQRVEARAPKSQQPHTFLQFALQWEDSDAPGLLRNASLAFVLLSGSGGVSMKFNPGLQAFSRLIDGLQQNPSQAQPLFQAHQLTQLLSPFFASGLNFHFLFVDGRARGLADSLATLEFGSKLRKIPQQPKAGRSVNLNEEIKEAREAIRALRGSLGLAIAQPHQMIHEISPQQLKALKEKIAALEKLKQESWENKRERSQQALEARKAALISEGLGFVLAENLPVPEALNRQAKAALGKILQLRRQAEQEAANGEDSQAQAILVAEEDYRAVLHKLAALQERQRQRTLFNSPQDQARFNRFSPQDLQRAMESDQELVQQLSQADSQAQVDSIRTAWERQFFYARLVEGEFLHELALQRQQEQMWATFKNYREHFEEQRQRTEGKYRELMESAVKDAIKLAEENNKLKAALENKWKKI